MNPDKMRFDCLGKDFIRLYGLVSRLPEGALGVANKEADMLGVRPSELENGCEIYPLRANVFESAIFIGRFHYPEGSENGTAVGGQEPHIEFDFIGAHYSIYQDQPAPKSFATTRHLLEAFNPSA